MQRLEGPGRSPGSPRKRPSHPGELVQPASVLPSQGTREEPPSLWKAGAGTGCVSGTPGSPEPLQIPGTQPSGPLGSCLPPFSISVRMELLVGTQSCFPKSLLLSASFLALWPPQGSQAALHIQKIPEQPQKNQDLLLSLEGVPDSFQDFTWYLGEEPHGGTMLFTYIPGLQRPQREGNAMRQRDAVGFRNGSMLLRRVQPSDGGTYHVAVTVNPAWTMRAKTEVQVAEKHQQLPAASLPVGAGILAAAVLGSLAAGFLLVGSLAYLLVTRGWRGRSPRATASEKPELDPSQEAGDNNVYEVMPSPVLLVSPLSDLRPMSPAMPRPLPPPPQPESEARQYQDLLHPDHAPYCQLVPTS